MLLCVCFVSKSSPCPFLVPLSPACWGKRSVAQLRPLPPRRAPFSRPADRNRRLVKVRASFAFKDWRNSMTRCRGYRSTGGGSNVRLDRRRLIRNFQCWTVDIYIMLSLDAAWPLTVKTISVIMYSAGSTAHVLALQRNLQAVQLGFYSRGSSRRVSSSMIRLRIRHSLGDHKGTVISSASPSEGLQESGPKNIYQKFWSWSGSWRPGRPRSLPRSPTRSASGRPLVVCCC